MGMRIRASMRMSADEGMSGGASWSMHATIRNWSGAISTDLLT